MWILYVQYKFTVDITSSTFVCPTEIIAFSDRVDEFRKIGCEVIAASTDSHFCHLAWVNTPRKDGGLGSLNIPLLADKSASIAKAYGVYNEETGVPFRGLFIIDGKGLLRQVTINDLPVGRSVDETLRLVQAFQFTDEHGEGKIILCFSFSTFRFGVNDDYILFIASLFKPNYCRRSHELPTG